jgi:peptidoglycan/LPS O-acetylase OafA/YrhL
LYWPQLDGLRFVAAGLVFIAHAPVLPVPGFQLLKEFGWVGVDLFLVLSAFLLTRLLRTEHEINGTIDIRSFYIRRMLRIWPLHWGFITIMLGIHCVLHRDTIKDGVGFWMSHALFTNNVVVSTIGFERRLAFTSHLWTISLEEQFYAIIPLVVTGVLNCMVTTRKLLITLGVVILLLMGIRFSCGLLQISHPFIWVLPIRADSIAFGMALGLGVFQNCLIGLRGIGCFSFGCGVLALAANMPSLEVIGWQQVFGYTLVDFGCVLLVAGLMEGSFVAKVFACQTFRYLGKISFGLYVYHLFALAGAKRIAEIIGLNRPWVEFSIGACLTVLCASLSYHLFERRFLLLKERFAWVKTRPA